MADKSRFGLELTEAEINALVDTEELLILEFLIKQLFYSGLIITNSALRSSLAIDHFISSAPSKS